LKEAWAKLCKEFSENKEKVVENEFQDIKISDL
jgi:hypothetical protein